MKPILFNTEMVRAILEGRKTVTRRVVKPQPTFFYTYGGRIPDPDNPDNIAFLAMSEKNGKDTEEIFVSPYQTGDILYARETFFEHKNHFYYKADGKHEVLAMLGITFKWRPSIHMPRKAARIFLRVKEVRVERLQDITESDILEKEGLTVDFPQPKPTYMSLAYTETRLKPAVRKAFANLWNSTVKVKDRMLYGWAANPWVWVIEFERCIQ